MTINNVNNAGQPRAAAQPKAVTGNAPATQASARPAIAGDVLKARDPVSDEAALNEFIAQNKAKYPEIEAAKLNLSEHLAAGAVLFVLSGAVGFASHEIIRRLSDKKYAFVEAKAMSTDPVERKLVAQKAERISLGSAMRLAADPDLSVRYAIASRMKSRPDEFDAAVLEVLANDPNPLIRGMVASSDKLSEKTVSKLANSDTETSPQVRAAALGNKKLPKDQRKWLEDLDAAKGGIYATMVRILSKPDADPEVAKQKLGFLRSNPNIGLTREMMEALAKSENAGVREALGRRADCPDDLIKQMYEHRSYTFMQTIKGWFGLNKGLPAGKPKYETDRVVLMSLAGNPNASVSMLTHMVENVKKDGNNSFRSSIDPKIDVKLGIPTVDADSRAYNVDIVLRSIVGNPRTDDTMRVLANAAMTPYRIDEKRSLEAYLSLNAANGLYMNGKYGEAADAYKKAIGTTFHDSEQAYFELGQCLMAMNQVEAASNAFIQALNINGRYTAAAEMLDAINQGRGGR